MHNADWLAEAVRRLAAELADPDAPRLGVHVMSEFMYCPRAGIVSFDQAEEDHGSESPKAPALGGLPTHDIDVIRSRLEYYGEWILYAAFGNLAPGLATVAFLWWTSGGLIAIIGGLALATLLLRWKKNPLRTALTKYYTLRRRLADAEVAAVSEPDWSLRVPQEIQWWSLIRAGFVSVEKRAAIVDRELHLAGKPFRVLQRGDKHIPVMNIDVEAEDDDPRLHGRLSPQQRARLAAYAYLVHRIERAQSDWVIVVFKRGHRGVAIPVDDAMFSLFAEGLSAARRQLAEYLDNPRMTPDPARSTSPCIRCRHGKPREAKEALVFRGVKVAYFVTEATDGKRFHCACGDRFRWVPPHEEAKRLGLTTRS